MRPIILVTEKVRKGYILMIPTSKYFKCNNIEIHCQQWSENGHPLLLIHGITSSSTSWNRIAPQLAYEYKVFALDLRGHGLSSKPEHGYDWIKDYAKDVSEFIRIHIKEPPVIIGHSLGASVTAAVAANPASQLRAIILEDPPAFLDDEPGIVSERFASTLDMKALPFEEKVKAFMDAGREWPPKTMEINRELAEYKALNLENTADAVITEIRTENTSYRAESLYPNIKCPCLILLGNPNLGGLVELNDRKRLSSILKQAAIKEFPDAGHGLHNDAEKDFLKHVNQFLISLG